MAWSNRYIADELEPRVLLAATIRVNFQPSDAPIPAGYFADSGATFADRGNGYSYGWDADDTTAVRDRNAPSSVDQRYDTFAHMQLGGVNRKWEIALPNGAYQVRVVAGDPNYYDSNDRITADGALVLAGVPSAQNPWIDATRTVTVADGRLTISPTSTATNAKIDFIEITPGVMPSSAVQKPFGNTPIILPGVIQTENYDNGGSGTAYSDSDPTNDGGLYRPNAVDIGLTKDTTGGYYVGWTNAGEWLEYTISATTTGIYSIETRLASGNHGTFHIEVDGINKTGAIDVPVTGGWQIYQSVITNGVSLTAGTHVLRLAVDSAANPAMGVANFNYIRLTQATQTAPTVTISATDPSASEQGDDAGQFTITRTGSTADALDVTLRIAGTATNGVDYDEITSLVTIPAGKNSVTVDVTPKPDAIAETKETVSAMLVLKPAYVVGARYSATVTISDEDSSHWVKDWKLAASAPTTRFEAHGFVMFNKLYMMGGWLDPELDSSTRVDVYDPATNSWQQLRDMQAPETHSGMAVDAEHYNVYFVAGHRGEYPSTPTNDTWRYNAGSDTWTQLAPIPTIGGAGAAVLLDRTLHYIGGCLADRVTNTAQHWTLDLDTPGATWKAAAPMPVAVDHVAGLALNGKIYAVGGEIGHDKLHNQQSLVQVYDPATNKWTRAASMPRPKSHAESSTFVMNGRIISAAGQNDDAYVQAPTNSVNLYEPQTNRWIPLGNLPAARQGTIIQQVGNFIILTAGGTRTLAPQNTTWIGEIQ
jgi:N-acetylneuraminic acid mutarotase